MRAVRAVESAALTALRIAAVVEYCRGRLGVVRARASVARVTRLVLALSSAMGAFTARYKPRRLSVAKQ